MLTLPAFPGLIDFLAKTTVSAKTRRLASGRIVPVVGYTDGRRSKAQALSKLAERTSENAETASQLAHAEHDPLFRGHLHSKAANLHHLALKRHNLAAGAMGKKDAPRQQWHLSMAIEHDKRMRGHQTGITMLDPDRPKPSHANQDKRLTMRYWQMVNSAAAKLSQLDEEILDDILERAQQPVERPLLMEQTGLADGKSVVKRSAMQDQTMKLVHEHGFFIASQGEKGRMLRHATADVVVLYEYRGKTNTIRTVGRSKRKEG